jgi:galactose oxidase
VYIQYGSHRHKTMTASHQQQVREACRLLNRICLIAATLAFLPGALAEARTVIVGITPTCPYGLSACWAGAYGALSSLEGVKSVARTPDVYNCTAAVELEGNLIPCVRRWREQFVSATGDVYKFRGVEVSLNGPVERDGNDWVLKCPDIKDRVVLARLNHKLQWNFRKARARQREPDERRAFNELTSRVEGERGPADVEIVGPLRFRGDEVVVEVREFYWKQFTAR